MTKRDLAEQILQYVENSVELISECDDCLATFDDRNDVLDGIISLIDTLQPRDIEQFAKWGYPEQQSTAETCWI